MKPASVYQRICGTISGEISAGSDMGLDADEGFVYFKMGRTEAAKHLSPGTKIEDIRSEKYGRRPGGLMSMNMQKPN
jgi:oligogalacturonide lyase